MYLVDPASGAGTLPTRLPPPLDGNAGWHTVRGADWGELDIRPLQPDWQLERLSTRPLGPLRYNHFALSGVQLRRTPGHLHAEAPSYVLALPLRGASRSRIDRHEVTVEPGHLYLLHGTVAAEIQPQGRYETFNLQIPAHLLQQRLPVLPKVFRARLDGHDPRAELLQGHARHTHALAAQARGDEAELLAVQLCDLVAMLLRGDERASQDDRSLSAAHTRRVLDFIGAHYAREDLSGRSIAQECGISERYLHKLFHASGRPVMERVRQLRLERARTMLANPALATLPVSEVAYRNGFRSLSSFSRAFRQHHGLAPSEVRHGG